MAGTYAKPYRLRIRGDATLAALRVGRARHLLGALAEVAAHSISISQHRTVTDPDGTVFTLSVTSSLAIAEIDVTGVKVTQDETTEVDIWVPRGFVVYPVTDAAPTGWGYPIIQQGTNEFATANLAPGLDVSRWTVDGVLGQVLLSAVPNAGYPKAGKTVLPMLFNSHKSENAFPKTPKGGTRIDIKYDSYTSGWLAYRPEHWPLTNKAIAQTQGERVKGFRLLNAHRESIGRDKLMLPFRGYGSVADQFTTMMLQTGVAGHYSDRWYKTYRTPSDRAFKDGAGSYQGYNAADPGHFDPNDRNYAQVTNENVAFAALGVNNIGTDPNGEPIVEMTGVAALSQADAFEGWLLSPPHKATIEHVFWDQYSTTADIGYNLVDTEQFTRHDMWIKCGSASWTSSHPEIPILSWHSFRSMNLTLETYPVAVDLSHLSDKVKFYQPSIIPAPPTRPTVDLAVGNIVWSDPHTVADMAALTVSLKVHPFSDPDTKGLWLSYITSGTDWQNTERTDPALTPMVYMRGRAIGTAPNGGLVLSAGIEKIVPNLTTQPTRYRLKIIVYDPLEQPPDPITNGFMAVAHLYHCDLTDIAGFAAHTDNFIKGVRGHLPSSWPWLEDPDPWAWVDDGIIETRYSGDMAEPDMLRYACLWRFNPEGTEAACLKYSESLTMIKQSMYANTITNWLSYTPGSGNVSTANYIERSLTYWQTSFTGYGTRCMKILWGNSGYPDYNVTTSTDVMPQPAGIHLSLLPDLALPIVVMPPVATRVGIYSYIAALDYAPDGTLTYAMDLEQILDGWYGSFEFRIIPRAICRTTNYNAKVPADFELVTQVDDGTPSKCINYSQVIDVLDLVVMQTSLYPPNEIFMNSGSGVSYLDVRSIVNPYGCWNDPVYVTVWRNGEKIDNLRSFENHTDRIVIDWVWVCVSDAIGAITFVSTSGMFQGAYAKQRNGHWVFSYQFSPQPPFANRYTGPLGDCAYLGLTCLPTAYQVWANEGTTYLEREAVKSRGGWCTSSFGDQAALASMMRTPGENLRLVNVRAV